MRLLKACCQLPAAACVLPQTPALCPAGCPQLPELSEIDNLLKGNKQNTIVFFLDETFDELT